MFSVLINFVLFILQVCVAMRSGLVQLYSQKHLVDQFDTNDSVMAMYFGRLGLEEQVLVLILRSKFNF